MKPSLSLHSHLVAAVLLAAVALPSTSAVAQTTDSALNAAQVERINAAAAQRMLSQRMAKAYVMGVLGVNPAQSGEILAASVRQFKANAALLRAANLPPETQRLIALVETQATPMLTAAAAAPAKESVAAVIKSSEDTLAAAETAVRAMPALTIPGASLIVLAGRQRMLSQRAAKYFLLYQTGNKTPEVRAAYEKSMRDFEAVQREFSAMSDEFPGIRDNLELASVQMEFFKTAARSIDAPTDAQKTTVARSSERVLETMDEMVKEIATKFTAKEGVAPAAAKKR
ncbi:MAG: hypothetical protein EAZ30_03095 [Betaproteobacteria bacterium]|nr:MAG: hypothetical protein EAZ30_03095 [Betaproteobacteria bacterium]